MINACNALILNKRSEYEKLQDDQEENPLFSTEGTFFWPSVIIGRSELHEGRKPENPENGAILLGLVFSCGKYHIKKAFLRVSH